MDFDRLPQPNENNRWYHYNDSDAVIVFVHGVLSDSRGCWLSQDAESTQPVCYWPELIRSDPRFNGIGIFLAGYHTAVDSGDFPIQQCANEVYSYLKTADPQAHLPVMHKKTIIFVCHSMGGVVARYLLCEHRDAFEDKRIGLVLIASPSYGSQLARSLDEVIRLYNHAQGKQLKWGNAILKDLDQRFKNLKESGRLPELYGVEFFENRFLIRSRWLPIFTRTKVVVEESAARYFGYAKQVGGSDHSSICKPRSMTDTVHQYLLEFVQDNKLLPIKVLNNEAGPVDGVAPLRLEHASVGLGSAVSSPTATSIQLNFIAQSSAAAPLISGELSATAQDPAAQLARQLTMMLGGQVPAAVLEAVQEKPRLEDLFEVIGDPDVVYRALYQTESDRGLAPYDAAYVNAREQIADVQEALETTLRQARGRLLICGPRGIGKTREIAELARRLRRPVEDPGGASRGKLPPRSAAIDPG